MMKNEHSHLLESMIRTAMRSNDSYIGGRALGDKPRFFIIGDEPNYKDYILERPFAGPMDEMLQNCLLTLQKKYPGTELTDLYTTYLVKTTFQKGQLTEEMVINEWLPIAQLEYYMSGCDFVVGVGPVSRMFTRAISVKPQFLPGKKSLWQKAKEVVFGG